LICLSDCTAQMSIPAPASAWPSVTESWNTITVAFGSNPNPEQDQPSTSSSPSDNPAPRRPQILVIEDNKADVFLIRKAIAAAKVDADLNFLQDGRAATDFFDAADNEKAACPDLVLLDLNLPKKSGDDVLKHLRNSKKCRCALVLVVTSSDSQRDREAVAALSVAGYFRKPSEYADFMKLGPIVKALLERSGDD